MSERGDPEPSILLDLFITFQLSAQALELTFTEHGLDVPDFAILSTIGVEGPTTATALARRLGMAQRTALFRVRRLARDGLLERLRSPNDRRAIELRLTTEGRELLRVAGPVFRDLIVRLESRLRLEPDAVREGIRDLGAALAAEIAAHESTLDRRPDRKPRRQADAMQGTTSPRAR